MTDLTALTTPTRLAPDLFQADVPDGWQQGRGAFGGLVLANLVRAITRCDEADSATAPRPLRALTATLCGPVLPGPNRIRIERLRAGTGVAAIAARIERDGEVLAHAVGVLGRPRAEDASFTELERPALPPWRELEPIDLGPPSGPPFARNFEYRPVGPASFAQGKEAIATGWVRAREPGTTRDAAYVTALVDAWWPSIFTRLAAPRPMATVTFGLHLLDGLDGLDPAAPFAYRARGLAARAGYLAEVRELWGEDGRLLAVNEQTFTIIK